MFAEEKVNEVTHMHKHIHIKHTQRTHDGDKFVVGHFGKNFTRLLINNLILLYVLFR